MIDPWGTPKKKLFIILPVCSHEYSAGGYSE